MRVLVTRVSCSVLLGGAAVVGVAGPASAQVCDAYSGRCTQPPSVLPETLTRGAPSSTVGSTVGSAVGSTVGSTAPTSQTPATLPFTGGELVLLSAAGAGALAAGTALVLAGRRRKAAPAT